MPKKTPKKKKQAVPETTTAKPIVVVDDERLGLPSASGMDADIRCLGRRALCAKMPKEPESAAARRGTRIHLVMEGKLGLDDLPDSDRRTAHRMMDEEARLVHELGFEGAEIIREERKFAYNEDFQPLYSAKSDTIYLKEKRSLVIDYKSGWSAGVPIDKNWQMRTQCVVVSMHHDIEESIALLLHPNHPDSLSEVRIYTKAELNEAADELEKWCSLMDENAPRTPNHISCQYCAARTICSEYQAEMDRYLKDGQIDIRPKYELISPAERGNRLKLFKLAEAMVKAERAVYKEMLEKDPAAVEGWKLRPSSMRVITDNVAASQAVRSQYGADVEKVLEISLTKLEELMVSNGTRKSDVKEAVKRLLGAAMATKEKDPSLVEA